MAPYDSDSVAEESSCEEDYKLDDDRTILRRGRQPLGLTQKYVPAWNSGHAMREYYQNWKDAILESAHLQEKDFNPVIRGFDTKGTYIVESRHPITSELLGFIRFKDGTLQLTNFKAQLSRNALDLGETTKRGNREAAGTHGEGFKVASLVMVRRGFRVQYEASRFYWTMKLAGKDQNMLYCFLTEMTETKLFKQMEVHRKKVANGTPRELNNNIWEDVSLKIGRIRGQGTKISKEDFLKWIEVSIDLNRPSNIIRTQQGDLIMDERFSGKIYLKGLLLEGISTRKPFRFGYNLRKGKVNRDRERLKNPEDEARVLAQIWAEAIQSHEEDTITNYVAMLRDDRWADVDEVGAYISETTAKTIWAHLQILNSDRKLFYYESFDGGDKDAELIRNSLKQKPERLPNVLWIPLRRFGLVRTPKEQQFHLLHNAPTAEDPGTPYSAGVQRALRAALVLDTRTIYLKLIFKCGNSADLDLLLFESTLEVNDKWLRFEESHAKTRCWLSSHPSRTHSDVDHFSCDHIVTDLYEMIVEELKRHPNHSGEQEFDDALHMTVCESVRQMPIMVEAKATNEPGEIEVSWADMDRDVAFKVYGVDPTCRVTLHRESTCTTRRGELLAPSGQEREQSLFGAEISSILPCYCHEKIVSRRKSRVTFTHLDCQERYFPMVSRVDTPAFFGVPPDSISPNLARTTPLSTTSARTNRSGITPPSLAYSPTNGNSKFDPENDGFTGLYNASSDEDEASSRAQRALRSAPANDKSLSTPSSRHGRRHLRSLTRNKQSQEEIVESDLELEELKRLNNAQDKELAYTRTELQRIRLELDSQKKLLSLRDLTIQDLKAEIIDQRTRLQLRDRRLEENQLQVEAQQNELFALNSQEHVREKDVQIEAQRIQLLEANRINETGEERTTALGMRIKKLTEDLGAAHEEIQTIQKRVDDYKSRVENIESRELDSNAAAEDIRLKLLQLKEVNESLETRLELAEEAYDEQVKLAARTAERRSHQPSAVKRKGTNDEDVSGYESPVAKRIKTDF